MYLDRPVCQQVGEIASSFDRRDVFPQAVTAERSKPRSIRGLMGEVVGCATEDAEELVVAMLVGSELRSPSKMPFADQGCVVAVLPDERGDRRVAGRQPDVGRASSRQGLLQPDVQPLRVASGEKRTSRRRADGSCGVGARERDSLLGEPIERGRLVVGAAVTAQIAIAQIVREDEEDVWSGTLRQAICRQGTDCRRHGRAGSDLEKLATRDPPPHGTMLGKITPVVNHRPSILIDSAAIP